MQRRMPTWAWTLLGVVAVVGAALLAPIIAAEQPFAPAPTPSAEEAEAGAGADSGAAADHTAAEVLATLPVKGRAPKTGYDRDEFGQRWLDVDRNGCDTRNDILARDLTDITRSGPCTVVTGILADPFTGATIPFVRGQDTSALVQIDHVVSLSDAWQKGAQQLTPDQRASFANDPLNLLAVDGSSNAQKGDGDAASWLPKNRDFRCAYVARQVSVKAAYRLWVTQAEHDAIAKVLASCPNEPALTSASAAPAPAADVSYADCDEVRAAGAAPILEGQPGYSRRLDRNGDGVGCE